MADPETNPPAAPARVRWGTRFVLFVLSAQPTTQLSSLPTDSSADRGQDFNNVFDKPSTPKRLFLNLQDHR
jgi:hypothetical protein